MVAGEKNSKSTNQFFFAKDSQYKTKFAVFDWKKEINSFFLNFMNNIIILQARLNSKRLPKKVLMEINGHPLIVIAARRVKMSEASLLVVIPKSKSNDELAKKLELFKISYFRKEKNVLKRFINATKNFQNDANIIRLTSDNIFPDKKI